MKRILSYRKAREIVLSFFCELDSEAMGLHGCLGRVSSSDIRSPMDSPPFARAAMDGFACHGKDVLQASPSDPVRLRLSGSSMAGEVFEGRVEIGRCVEVATGSAMPSGCDCVVMKEYTKREDGTIIVEERGHPFLNVSRRGEDFRKGEVIVKKGRALLPQDLGILKSCGMKKISVKKKPRMGIMITGSELVSDPSKMEMGKILESNSIVLYSLCQKCGAQVSFQRIVGDEEGSIRRAIEEGKKKSDLLLVTGGSSMGERDYVARLVDPFFSGVAMRPGRPFGFAKNVFIMSGYPVACLVQYYAFVLPTLERMLSTKIQRHAYGVLQERIASEVGRTDFVRVKMEEDMVYPIALRGSGIMSSAVLSDGLLIIDEKKEGLEAKEKVKVHLWI